MQIPRLVTIADLQQSMSYKAPLIERAMRLSSYWDAWKVQNQEPYAYEVESRPSKERAPGIHASEIGCQRRVTYSLAATPRQTVIREVAPGEDENMSDINMQRRFDLGHAVHAMIQTEFELFCDWMNRTAGRVVITFHREVGINPSVGPLAAQWEMFSHCDGVFVFWHEGEQYLRVAAEIKTKSGDEFKKLQKPDEEHQEQGCFYQAALDVPLIWFVYYNKSNSNYTKSEPPWFYQFDANLWNNLQTRFYGSMQHRAAGTLPDRNEGIHCRWCPFSYKCQPSIATRSRTFLPQTTAYRAGALRR